MADNRPMPRIGVDKYTIFPITAEADGTITYGEAQPLPGVVTISPTDSGGTDVFSADNGAYAVTPYTENYGHELTNADIPPEIDAMMRGLELDNGLLTVGADTKTPYFGVAWRILKKDGTYRYVRYYKGVYGFASAVGGQTKPSSGAPENQTATATYTAVRRDSDGAYYSYIDSADLTETDVTTIETEWFDDLTWEPTAA